MFYNCVNINSDNLNKIENYGNITGFPWMFAYCNNIRILNNNTISFKGIKNISHMFYYCNNLNNISDDLDFTDVEDASYLFGYINNRRGIPNRIPNFQNTNNLKSIAGLYAQWNSLSNYYATIPYNTDNVENVSRLFTSCYYLRGVANFNTAKVKDMSYMFSGCS